ncbi:hypothetical protein [Streptomyces sp. NPDC050560]|uniref:hypothetical protein n=1 Tax=Streptomyces sp. NPDC050560 TaxID=3365630 RepID=UPI00379AE9B8
MRFTGPVRVCGAALAAVVLLAGCSGGGARSEGGGESGRPASGSAPPGGASASPGGFAFTPSPELLPRTRERAARLAAEVALEPGDLGPDFVRSDPYETDTATWPVLDRACVWRREPLPPGVLASLSRASEVPGKEPGRPRLRMSAVVTVHSSVAGADQEMATTLEEALQCPDQDLGAGQHVHGLISSGNPFGKRAQEYAEDSIGETGTFATDGDKGPYPYLWQIARIGQVTVAVAAKGGAGIDDAAFDDYSAHALPNMLSRLTDQLTGD